MPLVEQDPFVVAPLKDHPWSITFLSDLHCRGEHYQSSQSRIRRFTSWWCEYVEEEGDVTPATMDLRLVTAAHLEEYFRHRRQLGRRPSTVRTDFYRLRAWFKFLFLEGLIFHDPMAQLRRPKRPNTKVKERIISLEEAVAFLEAVKAAGSKRDLTIFALLAKLGPRASEVLRLTVDDVDQVTHDVRLIGKGRKERKVPLEGALRDQVYRYMATLPDTSPGAPLWPGHKGRPMSYGMLLSRFHRYRDRAEIPPVVGGVHVFRHYAITRMIETGWHLEDLIEVTGHSSVREIEPYVHLSTRVRRQRMGEAMGRAQRSIARSRKESC